MKPLLESQKTEKRIKALMRRIPPQEEFSKKEWGVINNEHWDLFGESVYIHHVPEESQEASERWVCGRELTQREQEWLRSTGAMERRDILIDGKVLTGALIYARAIRDDCTGDAWTTITDAEWALYHQWEKDQKTMKTKAYALLTSLYTRLDTIQVKEKELLRDLKKNQKEWKGIRPNFLSRHCAVHYISPHLYPLLTKDREKEDSLLERYARGAYGGHTFPEIVDMIERQEQTGVAFIRYNH